MPSQCLHKGPRRVFGQLGERDEQMGRFWRGVFWPRQAEALANCRSMTKNRMAPSTRPVGIAPPRDCRGWQSPAATLDGSVWGLDDILGAGVYDAHAGPQ